MIEIHDMKALIHSLVLRHTSLDMVAQNLTSYGIERISERRFKCVNKESKFYGKICKIKGDVYGCNNP